MRSEDIRIVLAGRDDELICQEIERQVWPPYNWITATAPTIPNYDSELHMVALDPFGRIVGTIDGCKFDWDGKIETLPKDGWQGVNDSAIAGFTGTPKYACALGASVLPEYRSLGIAKRLLEGLKRQAMDVCQYEGLTAPVLPSALWRVPSMSMAQYAELRLEDGRHFDPWVRIHEAIGGKIIGSTEESVVFEADRKVWEACAEMKLPDNGAILIDRASRELVLTDGVGKLVEGSLWLLHN